MDLEKMMVGNYIGFQKFDSTGVELLVAYNAVGGIVTVSFNDKLYNGSVVKIQNAEATISGQSAELQTAVDEGDVLSVTPPGGFTRTFPIHFVRGA